MTIPVSGVAAEPGAPREIRLEDLVGCLVRDIDGERIGRIRDLRAEWSGNECVVMEFHVGANALVERLGGGPFWAALVHLFGGGRSPHVVPWHLMDLRDVRRPRVTCRKAELEQVGR